MIIISSGQSTNVRRKVPFFGIYVVMFIDVSYTFLKVSVVVLMFVMAFAVGFYALLAEQENFDGTPHSFMKTFVMTIGEFEYDDIFFDNVFWCGGTNKCLPYKKLTMFFFFVFVIIMPILTMNLLVGLAVGDIQAVLENAMLQRLAMQVTKLIFPNIYCAYLSSH